MTRLEFTEELRTDRIDSETGKPIPSVRNRIKGALKRALRRAPDEDQIDEALAKVFELTVVNEYALIAAIFTAADDAASVAKERAKLRDEWIDETFSGARRIRGATGEECSICIPACLTVETPQTRMRAFVRPSDFRNRIVFRTSQTIEERRAVEDGYRRAMAQLIGN